MKRIFRKDERGITLQTLIVTAVLVLMAGAAGVVIVSITNSQADNLEGQNAGIEARCEPWEIFDPTLAAAGRGGTPANGGLESSAIGCRRVCYVQATTANADIAAADTLDDSAQLPANDKKAKLLMSRSSLVGANGLKAKTTTAGQIQVVIGDRAAKAATDLVGENRRIEVSTDNRYCRVWDDSSDSEVAELRSS